MTLAGIVVLAFLIVVFGLAFGYMLWADRRDRRLDDKEIDRFVREFESQIREKSS